MIIGYRALIRCDSNTGAEEIRLLLGGKVTLAGADLEVLLL